MGKVNIYHMGKELMTSLKQPVTFYVLVSTGNFLKAATIWMMENIFSCSEPINQDQTVFFSSLGAKKTFLSQSIDAYLYIHINYCTYA